MLIMLNHASNMLIMAKLMLATCYQHANHASNMLQHANHASNMLAHANHASNMLATC